MHVHVWKPSDPYHCTRHMPNRGKNLMKANTRRKPNKAWQKASAHRLARHRRSNSPSSCTELQTYRKYIADLKQLNT